MVGRGHHRGERIVRVRPQALHEARAAGRHPSRGAAPRALRETKPPPQEEGRRQAPQEPKESRPREGAGPPHRRQASEAKAGPLKEQIRADLRDALRAGDETRKTTLRLLLAAIRNAEIPPELKEGAPVEAAPQRRELGDEDVRAVIRREVKQRRDSIEAYEKARRADLVAKEEAELGVLSAYLPQQLSREEIAAAARAVIERVGARGPAD